MLTELYNFFWNLFSVSNSTTSLGGFMNSNITIFGFAMKVTNYFSILCAIISLIFIVVLCCLFIYKIIKLVGGLIR